MYGRPTGSPAPGSGGTITHAVGIHSDPAEAARQGTTSSAQYTGGYIYFTNGKIYSTSTGSGGSAYGDSFAHGDIIGVAFDLDNSKLYFSKNGVWQNSGDPTSGATGTGAISITSALTYFAIVTDLGGSANTSAINFGNGYFGTTAVSSATTDESGLGTFEYTVPTGYYALCTKNINAQEYS